MATVVLNKYTQLMSVMHWATAPAMMGTVATVMYSQFGAEKKDKGTWMWRHKSLGLLTAFLAAPRIAITLTSTKPADFSKIGWEKALGKITHLGLYGFLFVMPATGIAMGYFGGKGLPFFNTQFSGAAEPNKQIAGNAFKVHKNVGYYGKFLVPAHVGAAGFHLARGEAIFARVNPFVAAKAL